ncbi:hypothetical protein PIECOFPK_00474 [Mycovorax composti]|jgi:hypothetical protein|uniref:Uncharacterized protein n=2 Tax=Chitinophagaceae TaxID=563835 RepID=A0ABZ2EHA7_9BACT
MSSMKDEYTYINDKGQVVFTELYHLRRGYCCGNGCLHCPYDYKAVPEPRRTLLLNERKQKNKNPEQ